MDSLTQLALGAAVGEAVAGKKLGNKAMLWGAVAGTIPDLDVFTGFWMNDIESMAFHRGITHSILFAVVFPLICSALARYYYASLRNEGGWSERLWQIVWIIFGGLMIGGSSYLFFTQLNTLTFILFVGVSALGGYWIWRSFIHPHDDFEPISFRHWYIFFFLCFATHILIDAFTTYGTQILQPFSNMRFTTSTISVADPAYTIPLLLFLILASLYKRKNKTRSILNWIGLGLSSLYMIFTFVNKQHVDQKFHDRLEAMNIQSDHVLTNPTILNNILWHGIAEIDTAYVEGYYSLFDKKAPFEDMRFIPKNRGLIKATNCEDSENLKTLKWFSDDFYNFSIESDTFYYNDLRFGAIWMDEMGEEDKKVFYFRIDDDCSAHEIRDTDGIGEAWGIFVKRLKGE